MKSRFEPPVGPPEAAAPAATAPQPLAGAATKMRLTFPLSTGWSNPHNRLWHRWDKLTPEQRANVELKYEENVSAKALLELRRSVGDLARRLGKRQQ